MNCERVTIMLGALVFCMGGCAAPNGAGDRQPGGGSAPAPDWVRAELRCEPIVGLAVSWGAVDDATGYRAYRARSNQSFEDAGLVHENHTPTRTAFVDQEAPRGVDHVYWVVAKHESGASAATGPSAPDRIPADPAMPSGFSASDGSHCAVVELQWRGVRDATRYEIYWHTEADRNRATLLHTVPHRHTGTYSERHAVELPQCLHYWVEAVNECETRSAASYDTGYQTCPPGGPNPCR